MPNNSLRLKCGRKIIYRTPHSVNPKEPGVPVTPGLGIHEHCCRCKCEPLIQTCDPFPCDWLDPFDDPLDLSVYTLNDILLGYAANSGKLEVSVTTYSFPTMSGSIDTVGTYAAGTVVAAGFSITLDWFDLEEDLQFDVIIRGVSSEYAGWRLNAAPKDSTPVDPYYTLTTGPHYGLAPDPLPDPAFGDVLSVYMYVTEVDPDLGGWKTRACWEINGVKVYDGPIYPAGTNHSFPNVYTTVENYFYATNSPPKENVPLVKYDNYCVHPLPDGAAVAVNSIVMSDELPKVGAGSSIYKVLRRLKLIDPSTCKCKGDFAWLNSQPKEFWEREDKQKWLEDRLILEAKRRFGKADVPLIRRILNVVRRKIESRK